MEIVHLEGYTLIDLSKIVHIILLYPGQFIIGL